MQIEAVKCHIQMSNRPFDGYGYPFRQALKELRQRGMVIEYDRKRGMYYKVDKRDQVVIR